MSDHTPPPSGGYESAPPPPPPGGGYGGGYGGYGGVPQGSPPPNHLVWAILSTLFCCLPLGVASIVFAAQVNGKWSAGDVAGAQESSAKARKFALWSTIVGVVLTVLGIVLFIGLAALGTSSSTSP
jgi:predicted secreted protein